MQESANSLVCWFYTSFSRKRVMVMMTDGPMDREDGVEPW